MEGFFRGTSLYMEASFAKTYFHVSIKAQHRRLSVACNLVAGLICLMAFVRKRILRRSVPDTHATIWLRINDRGTALVARSWRAAGAWKIVHKASRRMRQNEKPLTQ